MAEIDLVALAINLIVRIIILSPVLWITGKAIAGKNAKFTDALWIVVLGTVIGAIFEALLGSTLGLLGTIIVFFIWLGLVKHFFDTGWLRAFAVVVLVVIIYAIIVIILAFLGLAIVIGSSIFG